MGNQHLPKLNLLGRNKTHCTVSEERSQCVPRDVSDTVGWPIDFLLAKEGSRCAVSMVRGAVGSLISQTQDFDPCYKVRIRLVIYHHSVFCNYFLSTHLVMDGSHSSVDHSVSLLINIWNRSDLPTPPPPLSPPKEENLKINK